MKLTRVVTVARPDPNGTGFYGSVSIPAGLRVVALDCPATPGGKVYAVDEFPEDLFPLGSVERHDALHYGVMVPCDAVHP